MSATAVRPPPPPSSPMESSPSIEARITERIHCFDLPALLDVLKTCGYTGDQIEYRSHRSLLSHGHLVQAISFEHTPRRRVVITVNLGLLSTQSPLPSFFFKAMDQIAHDRLEDFLGYFDHHLLRARLAGYSPERDEALVGDKAVAEDRLQVLRPKCPSSLHWLCTRIFPEAEVKVRRTTQRKSFPSAGLRLGSTTLGVGSAVGGFATIPQSGMEVSLYLDDPLAGDGTPWAFEARRRLDSQLLPRLEDGTLFLTVALTLRGHFSHAALKNNSHLAYDPLVGGPERDHTVILFSGNVSQGSHVGPRDTSAIPLVAT
jgi:hypothetical protein